MVDFPNMKGFSYRNLKYIRQWYLFYNEQVVFGQQVVAKLAMMFSFLLICKTKNNVIAQYALESTNLPIGISEYQLSKLIPKEIKSQLPTVEDIEANLSDDNK